MSIAAAEGIQRRLRLPALEDIDTAGVDQVRADRDVEAANCPASLFDDAHTAREAGLALLRLNGDVFIERDQLEAQPAGASIALQRQRLQSVVDDWPITTDEEKKRVLQIQ